MILNEGRDSMSKSCAIPTIVILFLAYRGSVAFGQADQEEPDLQTLAKAANETIARFGNQAASWTSTTTRQDSVKFVVKVVATPTMKRSVFSVEVMGRRKEIARVVVRDDVWHVIQDGVAAKYRPFEAAFNFPSTYFYLKRSNPQLVDATLGGGLGKFDGVRDGVAYYRTPIPEHLRKQIEHHLAEAERYKNQNPGKKFSAETSRGFDELRDLLKRGAFIAIEVASGIMVDNGTPKLRTKITEFRWLERVDQKDFSTDGHTWDDFTDDPTAGDRNDLAMFAHSAVWQPGVESPETDGRLVDVNTGRYRRIPFEGDIIFAGCFTPDRTGVVVTGMDTMVGVVGLYEIDLKTAANRQLGGDVLASGFCFRPAISPDGETIAVPHKGTAEGIQELQIYLVDRKTGEAIPLGEPRDFGPICWYPDGKGLLISVRETAGDTLCRMDLKGQINKLCQGSSPVFLGDGSRILFHDLETDLWKTCNHDGKEIRDYVDGFKDHGFPAPSPDGKRLIMVRFRGKRAPIPLVFDVGSNEGKPATNGVGLWSRPSWK